MITPPDGEVKFNFDATFKNGITTTGYVLRNASSVIVGTWVNCFQSENPYCVETEAATQALKLVGPAKVRQDYLYL